MNQKQIENLLIKLFFLILTPVVLIYLYGQMMFATGILTERQQRQCITSLEASRWQSVIDVAEGIYLNVSKDYQTNLEALEGSVEYWRGLYIGIQTQLASCKEGNSFLQDKLIN